MASIQNMFYSSSDLNYKSYKIYTGGNIDGEETNGLYTKINSYTGGEEISFNDASITMKSLQDGNNKNNTILIILIIEIILLVISLSIYVKRNYNRELA